VSEKRKTLESEFQEFLAAAYANQTVPKQIARQLRNAFFSGALVTTSALHEGVEFNSESEDLFPVCGKVMREIAEELVLFEAELEQELNNTRPH